MKKFKCPEIHLKRSAAPDWRQLLLCAACMIFMVLMTAMVVGQNRGLEDPFVNEEKYIRFMGFMIGFVLLANVYSFMADANFSTLIAAIGILFCVGAAYQFLFAGFTKYSLVGMGSLAVAAVVYLVCRRFNDMSDQWFWCGVVAVCLLLLINVIFGQEDKGAKLAIDLGFFTVQPGEYVKVLTMILGACSFHNRKRAFVYCGTTLLSCVVLVGLINDLGNTIVIFLMFVLMTYLLFDNRKLSLSIIAVAALALVVVVFLKPHALRRFTNLTKVMELRGNVPEQFFAIRSVLFGGIRGRGLADCASTLKINAIQHDAAMGGLTAIYGIGITTIAMMGYAVLAALPAFNRSVHPSGYLMLSQFSVYVALQAALNLGGTLDVLPYTGIVAPLISEGANQMLCFGVLLGLAAAAIHPKVC